MVQREISAGTFPAMSNDVENFDEYEVIFVGYPNMEQGFESVLCVWCTK